MTATDSDDDRNVIPLTGDCLVDPIRREIRKPFHKKPLTIAFSEIERVELTHEPETFLGIPVGNWFLCALLKTGEIIELAEFYMEGNALKAARRLRKNTDLPILDCTTSTPFPFPPPIPVLATPPPSSQSQMLYLNTDQDSVLPPPKGFHLRSFTKKGKPKKVLTIQFPDPPPEIILRQQIYGVSVILLGVAATIGLRLLVEVILFGLFPAMRLDNLVPSFWEVLVLGPLMMGMIVLILLLSLFRVSMPGLMYGMMLGILITLSARLFFVGNSLQFAGGGIILCLFVIGLSHRIRHGLHFHLLRQLYWLTPTDWVMQTLLSTESVSLWHIQDIRIEKENQLILLHNGKKLLLKYNPEAVFSLEEAAAYLRQEIAVRQRAMVKAADELEASLYQDP